MDLKIIGEGCDDCNQLYQNTLAAARELGIDAHIEKVENLMDIVKLGVMSAPSLMADGKLVISGQSPSKEKVKKILQKLL